MLRIMRVVGPEAEQSSDRMVAPEGLRASTFRYGQQELMIVSVPLPQVVIRFALSQAEGDVASRVILGQSNAGIASARGTSVRTVANQLQSIYRKMRIQSRAELVVAVLRIKALGLD